MDWYPQSMFTSAQAVAGVCFGKKTRLFWKVAVLGSLGLVYGWTGGRSFLSFCLSGGACLFEKKTCFGKTTDNILKLFVNNCYLLILFDNICQWCAWGPRDVGGQDNVMTRDVMPRPQDDGRAWQRFKNIAAAMKSSGPWHGASRPFRQDQRT